MSLNLQHSAALSSLCNQPSKVSSSQGTDASQPLVLGKHLSLISCASSLSIEEKIHQSTGNQLFARYLFTSDQMNRLKIFQEMEIHFKELIKSDPEKTQSCSILEKVNLNQDSQLLGHFIGDWLMFMGYGSSKNRRYFINRIKLMVGDSKAHRFAKIYTNLSLVGLAGQNLLQFLLETCRNGWQYFINELIKLQRSSKFKATL